MRVLRVSYSRKKNDGDYGHVEVSLDSEVGHGESPEKIIEILRQGCETEIDKTLNPNKYKVAPKPSTPSEPVKEEPVKEELKKEELKKKAPAKKKATTRKKKVKEIQYDRDNLAHKKEVSRLLDEHHPNWRSPELKPKAVELSTSLAGQTLYLDDKISEDFITKVKEGL